jgi:hypothetical protein
MSEIEINEVAFNAMMNYMKKTGQNSEGTVCMMKDMIHLVGIEQAFKNVMQVIRERHKNVDHKLEDIIYCAMLHVQSLPNSN